MNSFDFLWKLLDSHGVIESKKADCARLWDTYTIEQQRQIYCSIRGKLRAGKFVNYNPVKALKDNEPRAQAPQMLTFAEYYAKYGTTLERDGWKMTNPTGQKVIYVKGGQ